MSSLMKVRLNFVWQLLILLLPLYFTFALTPLPSFIMKAVENEGQLRINVPLTYEEIQSKHRKLNYKAHIY